MNTCHKLYSRSRIARMGFLFLLFLVALISSANDKVKSKCKDVEQKNILQAVWEHDIAEVKRLIECGANIDTTDSSGSTPLIHACSGVILEPVFNKEKRKAQIELFRTINESICSLLVSYKCDINAADTTGLTALQNAVIWGYLRTIKMLVSHGAELDKKDNIGSTALHIAAMLCKYEIVKVLVEHGASINLCDANGNTALHLLVKWGCKDKDGIANYLISMGADTSLKNKEGYTPLQIPRSSKMPGKSGCLEGRSYYYAFGNQPFDNKRIWGICTITSDTTVIIADSSGCSLVCNLQLDKYKLWHYQMMK